MQPSQLTWTAIAAVVIGGFVRAIKSDGMTIALANLGLPPVPKRFLPWLALILGSLAAVLDAKMLGSSWEQSAMLGLVATATAVLGHDLGKGVPGLGKALVFALVIGAGVTACKPAESPRAQIRGAVLTLAEATKIADDTCATVALAKKDAALATSCSEAYGQARAVLLAAESAIDSSDAAKAGDVPCAIAKAASALRHVTELVGNAGGKVPPVATDALQLATVIGGCRG